MSVDGKKLAVVHATARAYDAMQPYTREYLQGIDVMNFMDEGLIRELNKVGSLQPSLRRRFSRLLESADSAEPDLILIACTAFLPVVPDLISHTTARIVTPYEAVSRPVVGSFKRVGIVATVAGGIPPAEVAIHERDRQAGCETEVIPIVIDEAFGALSSGDQEAHDRLVMDALENTRDVDCLILSQFTLAHLEPELRVSCDVPVFATMTESMKYITGIML